MDIDAYINSNDQSLVSQCTAETRGQAHVPNQ